MDYGYRMLRHIVAQVFGNIGQAARLTLLLTFAPAVVLIVLFVALGIEDIDYSYPPADPTQLPDVNVGAVFLAVLTGVVVSVFTYCWAAVGWHRYVLLEEHGRGILPAWKGDEILAYIGRVFIIGIVLVVIVFLSLFLIGGILLGAGTGPIALVLLSGWVLGITWIMARIGLILPAAALGQKMTIGESWNATRSVSTDILVPLFVLALAMTVISQLNTAIFGASLINTVIAAAVYWVQTLLNLSLMTTLYGTQVQGRSLN